MFEKMSFLLGPSLCLMILAIAVNGDHHDELAKTLNQMAFDKDLINGIFRPIQNGFIKGGRHSSVFKGKAHECERDSDNLKVAIKFTPKIYINISNREYRMYTYLNAINNTEVEKFGFSAIHYYNEWNNEYMIMVFSRFEEDLINAFHRGCFSNTLKKGAANSLILFRNFVRQMKYMNSCGIRHNDIEPENIMLRGFQSFVIDFNNGTKSAINSDTGALLYASRGCHKIDIDKSSHMRNPKDDWESFLYTMLKMHKVQLKWFEFSFNGMEPKEAFKLCGKMKANTTDTINHIKTAIQSVPLLKVFLAFANETFNDQSAYPDYNGMDVLITKEIDQLLNPPSIVTKKSVAPLFDWLSYSDRRDGEKFLEENEKCLMAENICDPISMQPFKYEKVIYDYFSKPKQLEKQDSTEFLLQFAKFLTFGDKNLQ